MRRLLVLLTLAALLVAACGQDDAATVADDVEIPVTVADGAVADVVTTTTGIATTAPDEAAPDDAASAPETTTTAAVTTTAADTTTVAPTTTTTTSTPTVDPATAAAFEAFNASVATVVDQSDRLAGEFDALVGSIREHRADLIKGDRGDVCCSAHMEAIKTYQASISAELVAARSVLDELGPGQAQFADPLGPGQAQLVESIEAMLKDIDTIGSLWSGIGIGAGGGFADIDGILDGLTECEAIAKIITEYGDVCCSIRADI